MQKESARERNGGEARTAGRCLRCGGEIFQGEPAYLLDGGYLCPECLPDAARCWLAGRLTVAGSGEEGEGA